MAGKTRGRGGLRDRLLVKPGSTVNLADVDPNETFGHVKVTAEVKVAADLERLTSLQERLWAEHRHRVLIVLQGSDASGKGGTITHVMRAFNPLGCRVVGFGVPNPVELAHDYLWRVHQVVPGNGEISVFNRSHYEAVLVERVHSLVPEEVWSRRYDQINAFEQMLVEEGTTILKFFLHIDRDEQKRRLQARVSNPTKRWKFKMGDLAERKLWADYMAAFNEALMRCSTEQAPWFVIPANHNWFRNLAVGDIAAASLDALDPKYPPGEQIPKDLKIE